MHIESRHIRRLAESYLNRESLSPDQVREKRHVGGCNFCYEHYCAEYLLLISFRNMGIYPCTEIGSKTAFSMLSLLTIRLIENKLMISSVQSGENAGNWEFIRIPQLANARCEREIPENEYFVNRISEHSRISRENGQVCIQLDADVFPVEQLKVCVITDDIKDFYEFEYDPSLECYTVVLDDRCLSGQSTIEIVEVNYE